MENFSRDKLKPFTIKVPAWHFIYIDQAKNDSKNDFNGSVYLQAEFTSGDNTIKTPKIFLRNYTLNDQGTIYKVFLCSNMSNEEVTVEIKGGDDNSILYSFNAGFSIEQLDKSTVDSHLAGRLWELRTTTKIQPQVFAEILSFNNSVCKREIHTDANSVPTFSKYNLDISKGICQVISDPVNGEIIRLLDTKLTIEEMIDNVRVVNHYGHLGKPIS